MAVSPAGAVGLALVLAFAFAATLALIQSGRWNDLKMLLGSSIAARNSSDSTTALMSLTKGLSMSSVRTAMTFLMFSSRVSSLSASGGSARRKWRSCH